MRKQASKILILVIEQERCLEKSDLNLETTMHACMLAKY